MNIRIATTDTEITACYPVMREFRPHIAEEGFLSLIRGQESMGYRLAYVQDSNGVVAVAGFRVGENLAWGRFLYVDDLVIVLIGLSGHRSNGMTVGGTVLAYLFWGMGIQQVGASRAALFLNLVPVFAMLVSGALGTPPTPAQLTGGAIVLAGVSLAMMPVRRRATA